MIYDLQSTSRRHQREAALVPGEVPSQVATEEERPQEFVLRAVDSECSSAFTHTLRGAYTYTPRCNRGRF